MLENVENNAIAKTISLLDNYPEFVDLQTLDIALFQDLRESIGDDMFFAELVTTYFHSTEQLIGEIQNAFADQDAYKFVIAAHSLKSTSASIGATRLSQISKYLEKGSKTSEISISADILGLLNHEYIEVVRMIKIRVIEFMAK